jgi:type I restriction enzyme S subunit
VRGFSGKEIQGSRLTAGDLLITTSGDCGVVAMVEEEPDAFTCASNFIRVLRADQKLVVPRYLYHYCQTANFLNALRPFVRGTTLKNLASKPAFESVRIPLPSLIEQQEVATKLDAAERLWQIREISHLLLREIEQAWFAEFFGDPIENPMGWDDALLSDWVDSSAPITYGILKPGADVPGGIPYVRVVDIADGCVKSDRVRRTTREIEAGYQRSRLRSGDLVVSIRGHVGRVGVVPPELDGANITQDSARIRIAVEARDYVATALASPGMTRWLAKRTKGAAVQGINLGDLRLAPLPVPPHSVLLAFSTRVALSRQLLDHCLAQKQMIEDLIRGLRWEAFGDGF